MTKIPLEIIKGFDRAGTKEKLMDYIDSLKDGLYEISIDQIVGKLKLIRHYFALRDVLFKEGNTGYTRAELHSLAKDEILLPKVDDLSLFSLDDVDISDIKENEISIYWLSEKGLKIFIDEFKQFAFEKFNCYI